MLACYLRITCLVTYGHVLYQETSKNRPEYTQTESVSKRNQSEVGQFRTVFKNVAQLFKRSVQ